MQITGAVEFQAAPQAVWRQLVDPQALSQCTPGLATWEAVEPNKQFMVQLHWMVDRKNRLQFPATITWETLRPPALLVLSLEAQIGGQPVTAAGTIALKERTPADTLLEFTVEVEPPNKMLAQMMAGLAPRFIDGFFKCFKARLQPPLPPTAQKIV